MAITKNIYFQDDVADSLKYETNVSALINKLLREYYKTKNVPDISIEQATELVELTKTQEAIDKREKEILGESNGKI